MTNKDISTYIQRDPLKSVTSGAASNNVQAVLDELNHRTLKATPELVEQLAQSGVSVKNVCSLFNKSFQFLSENPELLEAFNRGRASIGARIRSKLIDAALEENSMPAAIYLDKIYGGDQVASEVNVNVTSTPLENVSTEDLLNVAFTVKDDKAD